MGTGANDIFGAASPGLSNPAPSAPPSTAVPAAVHTNRRRVILGGDLPRPAAFRAASARMFIVSSQTVFALQACLYESATAVPPGPPAIGAGKPVLAKDDGDIEEILTGLTFPVGNIAFGPDGALYLSNYSAFSGRPGMKGEILRVEVPSDED
jgi:hypothetical protein